MCSVVWIRPRGVVGASYGIVTPSSRAELLDSLSASLPKRACGGGERDMEREHYRWANGENAPRDLAGTRQEPMGTAYPWAAVRSAANAPEGRKAAHATMLREQAQTTTARQRNATEPTRPKRTVPSMVRFTPDEFLVIAERARACSCPPARFIREAALGAVPKAKRMAGNAELIRELSAIGTRLQELRSIVAGAGNALSAERCEAALMEVLEAVRRIG